MSGMLRTAAATPVLDMAPRVLTRIHPKPLSTRSALSFPNAQRRTSTSRRSCQATCISPPRQGPQNKKDACSGDKMRKRDYMSYWPTHPCCHCPLMRHSWFDSSATMDTRVEGLACSRARAVCTWELGGTATPVPLPSLYSHKNHLRS